MERYLSDLPRCDKRAHGYEAAVAWCEVGPEPQVLEQKVAGILHQPWRHRAYVFIDHFRSCRFSGLVDREKLRRGYRELVNADAAFTKNVFRSRYGRHAVCPAGIESKMGDDLRNLGRPHAVVEGKPQMKRHLDRLVAGDKGCQRYDATVSRR